MIENRHILSLIFYLVIHMFSQTYHALYMPSCEDFFFFFLTIFSSNQPTLIRPMEV